MSSLPFSNVEVQTGHLCSTASRKTALQKTSRFVVFMHGALQLLFGEGTTCRYPEIIQVVVDSRIIDRHRPRIIVHRVPECLPQRFGAT